MADQEVSKIIDWEQFEQTYLLWNEKVMEICDKYNICKKNRKMKGKCNRLLLKRKHEITKQLKKRDIGKEEIKILKKRRQLVLEHLEKERALENKRKVDRVIQDVKENGGVDSSTFWKVKNRLTGRPTTEVAAILDEYGVKQEDPQKIKEVYMKYFTDLLTTREAATVEEKNREELVNNIVKNMETICKNTAPPKLNRDDVKEVVKKLDTKKAGDRDNWNNEIVVRGGEEMLKSIENVIEAVDKNMYIPENWNKMSIKTTDKKGSKLVMPNKRGLFLTNIISKVYERVVKKRNVKVEEKRSVWQMGDSL